MERPWRGQWSEEKISKTLILAFEVIVQPPKTQFLTFSKVQKTHYGEKKWDQNHEKQLVPDRVLPRFNILLSPIVSNAKRLDADSNNAYYEFVVTAKDRGEPPRTGTATVRIYTENKNDEEPKFSQQVYTPNVDENAGPNTLVTTVVST